MASEFAKLDQLEDERADQFVYFVRVTFSNAAVRAKFVEWLRGGHLAEVVRAGALDAELVERELATDAPPGALRPIEARYHFASHAAFETYANGPAVALRAQGAALFPPTSGVVMTRGQARSLLRIPR